MVPMKSCFSKVAENNNTLLGNLHKEKDEKKHKTIKYPEK